jgi:hypothetical protein
MAGITLASGKVYNGELVAIGAPIRRSAVTDSARPAPRQKRTDVHVHVHGTALATAARDQASAPPRRPVMRRPGDQDPEPGELICIVAQHGETGDWMAMDANGNPLHVTSTGSGLEVRHAGTNGDAYAGAPGEFGMKDPLATDLRGIGQRALATLGRARDGADDVQGLAEFQRRLNAHFAGS